MLAAPICSMDPSSVETALKKANGTGQGVGAEGFLHPEPRYELEQHRLQCKEERARALRDFIRGSGPKEGSGSCKCVPVVQS